jgi:hypothetical protein
MVDPCSGGMNFAQNYLKLIVEVFRFIQATGAAKLTEP